ncbi:MAG: transposase [Candidatus Omnitrophota bacterium]|nr:transposase [Candidatus Omnitrophota bacterium]
MQNLESLAFAGIDNHKDQHTICLTDCLNRNLANFDISNDPRYFKELVSRVWEVSKQNNLSPVFGLEDTQSFGQKLAHFLISTGNYVQDVPPVKTERKRSKSAHPDKSDPNDAKAIAKVLIQEFDSLQTVNSVDELHLSIRELSNQREALVKEQTKVKNRCICLSISNIPLISGCLTIPFQKALWASGKNSPTLFI